MNHIKKIFNSDFSSVINITLITLLLFTLSGCELIGDIFKAGIWVGIIIVILVVALVLWIIRKFLG